jgi:hypothetical protein
MHTNPFATEAAQYTHLRHTYPDELFLRGGPPRLEAGRGNSRLDLLHSRVR